MPDILQEIILRKRIEVDRQMKLVTRKMLEQQLTGSDLRPANSMRTALSNSSGGIIAEFKRKSPSKGWIFAEAEIASVLPAYERGGASACSVLTDESFFGGSLDDLRMARSLVRLPLLRKEFIIDPYQIAEARVAGADAILLIAAVLTPHECHSLAQEAVSLEMEVLLEIHTEKELEYLHPNIAMLGINNRNLGTFETSLDHSYHLSEKFRQLGSDALLISESGISSPSTVTALRQLGFRGFLIGETFMRSGHPGESLTNFLKEVNHDH